jgi:hypothetical protein
VAWAPYSSISRAIVGRVVTDEQITLVAGRVGHGAVVAPSRGYKPERGLMARRDPQFAAVVDAGRQVLDRTSFSAIPAGFRCS